MTWITLNDVEGEPTLVNMDLVARASPARDSGSMLMFVDGLKMNVQQDGEAIKRLLGIGPSVHTLSIQELVGSALIMVRGPTKSENVKQAEGYLESAYALLQQTRNGA